MEEWTCFEFGLPYLLHQLEGPIEFTYRGLRCRLDVARHKRVPGSKTVSVLDDPFGRTDYTGVRLCLEGPVALGLEHIEPQDEQRIDLENRFGRNADAEYKRMLHQFLVGAVNAVVDAYAFSWGAWRFSPVQFVDLIGYSAHYVSNGTSPGKMVRSLQPDPDKATLERVSSALVADDKRGSFVRFLSTSGRLRTFWQLEMAAVRALFRRDTLATAIICVTALEVYIDDVLSERLPVIALPIDDLKKLLDIDINKPLTTVRNVLDAARLDPKLRRGLPKALNIRLTNRPFWQHWLKTRGVRNDAAHAGTPPSLEDAADGLITIRAMIEAIEKAATPGFLTSRQPGAASCSQDSHKSCSV